MFVEVWAEIHQEQFIKNWQLVTQGKKPKKIII